SDGFNESKLIVSRQLVGRFFSADAKPISRIWPLSQPDGSALRPRVALIADRYVVTWQMRGEEAGVHLRRFGPKGPRSDVFVQPRGTRPAIDGGGNGG